MFQRMFAALFKTPFSDPIQTELEKLEREASTAAPDYLALIYSRIGELWLEAGDVSQALHYFGSALDAFLEVGYYDNAAALCRRIIEVSPNVVRARGTLAFLALGEGLQHGPFEGQLEEYARQPLADYVDAARRAGVEQLAVKRLAIMAEVTDNAGIREMIGGYLLELGDPETADRVLGDVYAERNNQGNRDRGDQRKRWATALRSSVLDGRG